MIVKAMRKDGYLNRKADLMEKLVRRMQKTANQNA